MGDLAIKDGWVGALPIQVGAAQLKAVSHPVLTLIAPFPGQAGAMAAILGGALPEPGQSCEIAGQRCLWFARSSALLFGRAPVEAAAHGQIEDVSDGWSIAVLSGEHALDVLARLVPVDLRAMSEGEVVRTLLGHMQVAICAVEDGFEIFVMRSMAGTLAHEIAEAMARVAARERLR